MFCICQYWWPTEHKLQNPTRSPTHTSLGTQFNFLVCFWKMWISTSYSYFCWQVLLSWASLMIIYAVWATILWTNHSTLPNSLPGTAFRQNEIQIYLFNIFSNVRRSSEVFIKICLEHHSCSYQTLVIYAILQGYYIFPIQNFLKILTSSLSKHGKMAWSSYCFDFCFQTYTDIFRGELLTK